ncbi:MAG: hypothetical protein N2Z21_09305 [Candidatus Sumerlaeaceae bacterium]|nr:hypothetical protein [Candidatus Sumerlaeaceae bacterium]
MSGRDDSFSSQETTEARVPSPEAPALGQMAAEALRHLRPTSALELFDRIFVLWRLDWERYSLLGLLAVLPGLAVELYALWRWGSGTTPMSMEIVPWAFLAFVLQLLPVTVVVRHAFSRLVAVPSSRMGYRPLHLVFPRVVVGVLFIVFAMALILNWGLAVVEVAGPSLLSIVAFVGAVAASLWIGANLCLAPVLLALGWPRIFYALYKSWKFMVFSRFAASRWRDNAHWRLALLLSFPLACHGGLAVAVRLVQWLETGTLFAGAPLAFAAAHIIIGAALDVVLLPWLAIAGAALLIEAMCRRNALDIHMRLRNATGVDSIVGGE